MKEIGRIVRLQLQTKPLKWGDGENRKYDPQAIQEVPALTLTPDGCLHTSPNQTLTDVHHLHHPLSRNRQARGSANAISFNFTTHYQQLRHQFGGHLTDGIAGENILIETSQSWQIEQFILGITIRSHDGQLITLASVEIATPCLPFALFALHKPHRPSVELVKNALLFLDNGLRGFYCHWGNSPITLVGGETVFV